MQRLEIIDGPTKWDFIKSLGNNPLDAQRELVKFKTLPNRQNHTVAINMIKRKNPEPEGDDEWLFEGTEVSGRKIKGIFSTKTRRGWMEF